jgi:L-threonylcarbamoyladenylate synthase
MQTTVLPTSDPTAIDRAMSVLQNGGLVAFPTDTVYGLAAATFSPAAVERLFEAKTRAAAKAIAVLVGEIQQLRQLTPGLTEPARLLAERFWPGALTLVVPKSPRLPENLSAYPTVGVRMPDHPFALALLRRVGPLATTSANLSGAANPLTAQDVLDQLGGRIELLLDGGPCPGGVPSTVVDCTQDPPAILREGALSLVLIQAALASAGPAHE